jgi:hypothetical protein
MRPARARKSSTSSGRRQRARYLGIEVAGEPVPSLSPARWVEALRAALAADGVAELGFRLVRAGPTRAVVRVAAADLPSARHAWDRRAASPPPRELRTARTWGTLRGAKRWLGSEAPSAVPGAV